ncbi:MAG TPA: bifunctional hydroxymethylpyrimidine kinase/phosphomethylpyrimidine kinase [Polyangiaceae bacterium]|jgi:hydroxymethylpyrimidine/phosphomethylpyrimidine kinase
MSGARVRLPCALAIGGLDPGGGAGIGADLRAFEAAGAFGCAAVALLTVQSTAGLQAVQALGARERTSVVAQAREVLRHQRVRAIKVGALGSVANVLAVARLLARHPEVPAVIDTPIAPTRGLPRLLPRQAVRALMELLPKATLVTVNVAEAQALCGQRVRTVGEAHDVALALVAAGARAALVKGGHLEGASATDVLAVGDEVMELRARRLTIGAVHGTGCALASLIAGRLAVRTMRGPPDDRTLVEAVRWAKRTHHAALERAVDVGGPMRVLVFRARRP